MKYLLLLIFYFFINYISAQSVQRESISSSSGRYAFTASLQLQSNVGELLTGTHTAQQFFFTMGFIQPDGDIATVVNTSTNLMIGKAFPNPVSDVLHIEFEKDVSDLVIDVLDMMGRKQQIECLSERDAGTKKMELSCAKLAAGLYLVTIYSKKGDVYSTFKIKKI